MSEPPASIPPLMVIYQAAHRAVGMANPDDALRAA
jgi:hypothetical protein